VAQLLQEHPPAETENPALRQLLEKLQQLTEVYDQRVTAKHSKTGVRQIRRMRLRLGGEPLDIFRIHAISGPVVKGIFPFPRLVQLFPIPGRWEAIGLAGGISVTAATGGEVRRNFRLLLTAGVAGALPSHSDIGKDACCFSCDPTKLQAHVTCP